MKIEDKYDVCHFCERYLPKLLMTSIKIDNEYKFICKDAQSCLIEEQKRNKRKKKLNIR